VKFLVDAQLPRRVAAWLTSRGHDAMHTLDLPRRNLSSDADACAIADSENRELWRRINGLGILHVGETAARDIASNPAPCSTLRLVDRTTLPAWNVSFECGPRDEANVK